MIIFRKYEYFSLHYDAFQLPQGLGPLAGLKVARC